MKPSSPARAPRIAPLLFLLIVSFCTAAFAQSPPAATPEISPWAPEAMKALKAWRLGDKTQTKWADDELARNARDSQARRDAAAVSAMLLMASDSRKDVEDGRARMEALTREDPGILGRPDCCFAEGLAHRTLNESTLAINAFLLAAHGYENEGAFDALARTWIALADAWRIHNEWTTLIPGVPQPQPQSPEQAAAYRRARIEELLKKAREFTVRFAPREEDVNVLRFISEAPAAIELSLARTLLQGDASQPEGLAILERLASGPATTHAWAQANLELSRQREQAGDTARALELLDRVAHAGLGAESDAATVRLTALRDPRLELELERYAKPGVSVRVGVRARRIKSATLEVRRVALAEHITANQGRLLENKLSLDGASVVARPLDLAAAQKDSGDAQLFDVGPGTYVVALNGLTEAGAEITTRRLLIVSALRVAGWMAGRSAALWAIDASGNPLRAADLTFWVNNAIVPLQRPLANGVSLLDWPADGRLAREKHWLCVLQNADGVAFCEGQRTLEGDAPAPVALIPDRETARVGEELRLVGALLDDAPLEPDERIELEIRDTTDALKLRRRLSLSAARMFSLNIPITPDMTGVLHIVARRAARTLENARGRLTISVPSPEEADFSVVGRMPAWVKMDQPYIRGEFQATYPWGTPVRDARTQVRYRVSELPTGDDARELPRPNMSGYVRSDRLGRVLFSQSLTDFNLAGGRPIAVGVWNSVFGWDDRPRVGFLEALFGDRPAHAWITIEPAALVCGQPARLRLIWYDPSHNLPALPATLHVDGPVPADLRLAASIEGLRTEEWRPTQPGNYEIALELPLREGPPLIVKRTFSVAREASALVPASPIQMKAEFETEGTGRIIRVSLHGAHTGPLLLVADNGQPAAVRACPAQDTNEALTLAVPDSFVRGHLSVWSWSGAAPQLLAEGPIAAAAQRTQSLKLQLDSNAPAPGETVDVSVATGGVQPSGFTVLARLISAADLGGIPWNAGQARDPFTAGRSPEFSTRLRPRDTGDDPANLTEDFDPAQIRALFEGNALWADTRPLLNGRARFRVTIPQRQGEYRLIVSLWGAEGMLGQTLLELNAVAPVDVAADAPLRMLLGDRTAAGCTIWNPGAVPLEVVLRAQGTGAIRSDDLILTTGNATPTGDGGLRFQVPPRETTIARARIEASSAGSGEIQFAIQCAGRDIARSAVVQVEAAAPAPAADAKDAIHVRRSAYRLTPAPSGGSKVRREAEADWIRTPLTPNERVGTGETILIVEEFDLDRLRQIVQWRQQLPVTARTSLNPMPGIEPGGRLVSRTATELSWSAEKQPGRLRHEYVLIPVRPGACTFPAPRLTIDGAATAVRLETTLEALLVDDLSP